MAVATVTDKQLASGQVNSTGYAALPAAPGSCLMTAPMFSPIPFLIVLLVAGSLAVPYAHAQDSAAPPVDSSTVLATLKDLRAKQTALVNREKASVLASINAAMSDPVRAYEQALAAVQFKEGGNGPVENPRAAAEQRRKQAELLQNHDFITGLSLQLQYLSLTWQHQMGVKPAALIAPLLNYTQQVAAAGSAFDLYPELRKGVGESVFATYFQVGPFLAGMTEWETRPFNVEGIYENTILPEMRAEKDPRLLSYWDSHIQSESDQADASRNPLTINKFKNVRLPALLWSRAQDEVVLGRRNQAANDMLALIKAHPDHPDFQSWATQLETLVAPPPPATATPPAAGVAPAQPAT